jgi:hypothetical protein
MDEKQQLGALPLFLGVYTQGWSIAQFQQAAQDAKLLGCTSLLIKVADGLNYWYTGIGGWQAVLSTVSATLPAIPYMYCYGNAAGSSVSGEAAILAKIMQTVGIVTADMETEFNGQVIWAQQLCAALKPISGIFGVTSWADPIQQSWTGVLQALTPCVNFWMPQAYDDFLASLYLGQYSAYGLPVYPVLKLGSEVGPNNLLQNAQNAKSPIIALWEYQAIAAYAAIIKNIVAMLGGGNAVKIPAGWTDDGVTLTSPNGIPVTGPFRAYILDPHNNWDAMNYPLRAVESRNPLEISNQVLGPGQRLVCRWTTLEQTTGNVFQAWTGQELLAVESKLMQEKMALATIVTMAQGALK